MAGGSLGYFVEWCRKPAVSGVVQSVSSPMDILGCHYIKIPLFALPVESKGKVKPVQLGKLCLSCYLTHN